jgi:hypothetical protein
MKARYKRYLKIYMIPIIFITSSFIFTTFAWFAYSGLRRVSTEVDVKAWYIELSKAGDVVTNDIVITLDDVYPGMETVDEIVNIENKGDSDAKLSYKIMSARILDSSISGDALDDNSFMTDAFSHEYPFHVNIDLSKNYISSGGDSSTFEVSVSWPLDSGNDALDSLWGMNAYNFQNGERERLEQDSTYSSRPAIQIVISIIAEQYVDTNSSSDMRYNLGDTILYDVMLNKRCTSVSSTCLSTTVIDANNTLGDVNVSLLPSLYGNYLDSSFNNYSTVMDEFTSNWTAPTRSLTVNDLMYVVSKDVTNTFLNNDSISPQILGFVGYGNRINSEINKLISLNGYYTFLNDKFDYFVHSGCFWTNSVYNEENGFAFGKLNDLKSEIYGNSKSNECKVVPVIVAPKNNL